MKRQGLHLVAAITEVLRFLALMLLSGNLGLIAEQGGASRLVRYLAAPQLLFATGFFFLWLDAVRYAAYRPLLAVGKLVALAAFVPLAAFVFFSLTEPSLAARDPRAALAESLFVAVADLCSLVLLAFSRTPAAAVQEAPAGQGPDDIERIEV